MSEINNLRRENKKPKGVSQYNSKSAKQQIDSQRNPKMQNTQTGSVNLYSLNRQQASEDQRLQKSETIHQNQAQIQPLSPSKQAKNSFVSQQEAFDYNQSYQNDENLKGQKIICQNGQNMNQNQLMQYSLQQMDKQAQNCYSENPLICSESGENQGNLEENLYMNNNQQFFDMQQNPIQASFMQQFMGQNGQGNLNQNLNDFQDYFKNQQKNFLKQQPGIQLKQFAIQMFKSLSKLETKKLCQKAKIYFEKQQQADDLEIQRKLLQNTLNQNDLSQESDESEPHKCYLDEIEKAISKSPQLQENFMRFVTPQYEVESEQVIAEFSIQNPLLINYYTHLVYLYFYYLHSDNQEELFKIGSEIFNIIMPYAQQTDPRLIQLIPQETLELFKIDYESDGAAIKSWQYIGDQINSDEQDQSSSDPQTMNSHQSQNDTSDIQQDSSSNRNNFLNNQEIQSIQQSLTESNNLQHQPDSQQSSDNQLEQSLDDENTENQQYNKKQKINGSFNLYGIAGTNIIPQSALTGKNKSLQLQFNIQHQNQKNLNKHELKTFDNFFKSLKDEKDWISFCKLFKIYFDGVISLREFFNIYDAKFQTKVKQEIKDEIQKLLPTREQNRRAQSQLLNPWNDLDNQAFEKVPDSSYYRIEDKFPIPSCTGKMLNSVYFLNLNDRYLSLATGSEKTENSKFAFKNNYEEKIFQHEDKLYEYDTLIENIKNSQKRVNVIFNEYMYLSEVEQNNYKFPVNRLNPLRQYWDSKFRKSIQEQFFKEGKVLKEKDFVAFKKSLQDKKEFLQNQKNIHLNDILEQFKKNFTKSLDHKSFQYKQFKSQFLQKKYHLQKLKLLYENNLQKKRILPYQISILFGSGEIPENSNYRFFNTFGKDFNKVFDVKRLQNLEKEPDHPIDLKFMQIVPIEVLQKYQGKCPQARFIMNDKRIFETTIKLILQIIKLQSCSHHTSAQLFQEKEYQIKALRFILEKFLVIDNFEQIEKESQNIQQLTPKLVEVLMNSIQYYQMKYDGELETMQEVFPIDSTSIIQKKSNSNENSLNHNKEKDDQDQLFSQYQQNPENRKQSQDDQELKIQKNNIQDIQNEMVLYEKMNLNNDFNKSAYEETIQQKISSFQSLDELEKEKLVKHLEKEMDQSLFIPSFDNNSSQNNQKKKEYKLLYGSLNIYMFILYFYSIYERLLKAQDLVKAKVQQDFIDDFSQKEWASKFDSKIQNLIDERFQYLVKAIVSTLNLQNNTFDSSKYEDLARELLGNEAYLLFQIDKLIKTCSQQLIHFQTDVYCKASQNIFNEFENSETKKESAYISRFYQEANECQNFSQNNVQRQSQNPVQVTGAAANNKDNQNPPICQSAFRLMYSPQSNIVTAHYLCFNPVGLSDQKSNKNANTFSLQNYLDDNQQNGYQRFLMEYTKKDANQENQLQNEEDDFNQKEQIESIRNKLSQQCQPIFLKRNLLKMKRLRKDQKALVQENGMILHMIPLVYQLQFEINTQDIIIFKRNSLNSSEIKSLSNEQPISQSKNTTQITANKLKGKKSVLGKRKATTALEDIQYQNQVADDNQIPNFKLKDLQKQFRYKKIINERIGCLRQKLNETVIRRQSLPQNFINYRSDINRQAQDCEIFLTIEEEDKPDEVQSEETIDKNLLTQQGSQILPQTVNSSEQVKTRNSLGRQCKQSNEKCNSQVQASFNNGQNNLNNDKKCPIKVGPLNTINRSKNN